MSLIRKCDICKNEITEPTYVNLSAVRSKTESDEGQEFLYGIDICHQCHEKLRLYAVDTIRKESMLELSQKLIHDLNSNS